VSIARRQRAGRLESRIACRSLDRIIAWARATRGDVPLVRPLRQLTWIAFVGLAIVVLQLVRFPHRSGHSSAVGRIGGGRYRSWGCRCRLCRFQSHRIARWKLYWPLSGDCDVLRHRQAAGLPSKLVALALVAGTLAGILLGVLQVVSVAPPRHLGISTSNLASRGDAFLQRQPLWQFCS
jgi:hypothetical protein